MGIYGGKQEKMSPQLAIFSKSCSIGYEEVIGI